MNDYALLIGGCADGKRLHIRNGMTKIEIQRMPAPHKIPFNGPVPKLDYYNELYEKEYISGEHETFYVFKANTISADEMIKKLIEGYKP